MSLRRRLASLPLLCWLYPALLLAQPRPGGNIPHLEQHWIVTQLIVDGKPFLILGGELYNNSATSVDYMNAQPVYRFARRHGSRPLRIPWANKMIGRKPE
jgi:hypothetical protein